MARILNATKGTVIAQDVSIARSFWSRFKGLMLRGKMGEEEALLIQPSGSIHTAFMRFPIDVVFLDRELNVVKVAENVKPYRVALSSAHSALELPAGVASGAGIERGDKLVVDDQTETTAEHNLTAVGVIDKRDSATDNHCGPPMGV